MSSAAELQRGAAAFQTARLTECLWLLDHRNEDPAGDSAPAAVDQRGRAAQRLEEKKPCKPAPK